MLQLVCEIACIFVQRIAMLKGTKLYSIFGNKCPRCHEGEFFEKNNPYTKNFDKMNHYCSSCGENFERETGFYYGAMYVSYAFTVALGVAWFLMLYVFFGFDAMSFLISYSVLLIVLLPWIFRTSRLIWINFFTKYNKDAAGTAQRKVA